MHISLKVQLYFRTRVPAVLWNPSTHRIHQLS